MTNATILNTANANPFSASLVSYVNYATRAGIAVHGTKYMINGTLVALFPACNEEVIAEEVTIAEAIVMTEEEIRAQNLAIWKAMKEEEAAEKAAADATFLAENCAGEYAAPNFSCYDCGSGLKMTFSNIEKGYIMNQGNRVHDYNMKRKEMIAVIRFKGDVIVALEGVETNCYYDGKKLYIKK